MVASRIKKKSLGRPPLPKLITDDAETAAEAAEACSVSISRPIYDHDSFSKHYKQTTKPKTPLTEVICNEVKDAVTCNKRKCITSLRKWLPFVGIMRHYKRKWIVGDIISGISCGTVHIPQSLGYATLIGLPAVYGLYSSFFPLLVYFFFGTSHHLSIGTVAVVSLIVSSAITKQLPNLRYVLDPIVNATTTTATPSGSQPVNPNACASGTSTMSTAATEFSDGNNKNCVNVYT
jgi:solute carrier family 26 protein 5